MVVLEKGQVGLKNKIHTQRNIWYILLAMFTVGTFEVNFVFYSRGFLSFRFKEILKSIRLWVTESKINQN